MIIYNVNILADLSEKGYSQYRIRKENVLPESVMIRLRRKEPITFSSLDKICAILECQPGDLISWIPEKEQGD